MGSPLRVHHLLCTALFEGHGYSEGFCYGMEQMVSRLRENPHQEIIPVSCPDEICAHCPHLTAGDFCDSNQNKIAYKDRLLAQLTGISENREYRLSDLRTMVREKLTEEGFLILCKDCRWYVQGLCSHHKLMEKLKEV